MIDIYISSKAEYAPSWCEEKEELSESGFNLISTWIHESTDENDIDLKEFWARCIEEASSCDALILYDIKDSHLKGCLAEVGAALGNGKPVYVVGGNTALRTLKHHPLVSSWSILEEALAAVEEDYYFQNS